MNTDILMSTVLSTIASSSHKVL